MHSISNTTKKLLAALGMAACVAATATGCAAPTAPEQTGSKTEKLLAPKAVLEAHASAATRKAIGVVKWKVYRGKTDYVLTGYDAKGKPVKGVALAFLPGTSKTQSTPVLRGRVLDGSKFAARREYDARGKVSSNKTLATASRTFLQHAILDMGAAATSIYRKTHGGKVPRAGYFGEGFPGGPAAPATPPADPATPPPPPADPTGGGGLPIPFPPDDPFGGMGYPGGDPMGGGAGGACGMDMATILMSALQCLMSGGGANVGQCMQAAMAGASAGGTCGGAPPGGGAPPADPGGGDPYGDPAGGGAGGDPYGDPAGGGADPYGTGAASEAGDYGACMSCPAGGGYDDIGADPMNGDVYGGDMGGDGGGWDMGY